MFQHNLGKALDTGRIGRFPFGWCGFFAKEKGVAIGGAANQNACHPVVTHPLLRLG